MSSLRSALISAIVGALLLVMPSLRAAPSPFSAKQDRGGLTVIAKSEVAP